MYRRECLGTVTSAMWYSVRKGVILKPHTSASMDLYAKSICKYNLTFQRVAHSAYAIIDSMKLLHYTICWKHINFRLVIYVYDLC